MAGLIALVLLPLAIIAAQLACGATGAIENSFYKLAFIVPPVLYCRSRGIALGRDIFQWQNWRRQLPLAVGLGAAAAVIFLVAYAVLGNLLLDKAVITGKIHAQFSVDAGTVFLIAPFTIMINSLIEEFFYRGFAFGLLVARNRPVAYLLPAAVFCAQHLLFIYHWVTPLPLALAAVALFVFAVVLEAVDLQAQSLVAPWLIHVCGDLAMMAIAIELIF
jgi:membrane protease YdiL (CAAX protease family)